MQLVKIKNDPPSQYDGEYGLDIVSTPLKWLDLHIIKVVADVMPGDFDEALERADPDLNLALVVIALYRAGRVQRGTYAKVGHDLREMELESISIESDDDESTAGEGEDPPAAQTSGQDESESAVEKS